MNACAKNGRTTSNRDASGHGGSNIHSVHRPIVPAVHAMLHGRTRGAARERSTPPNAKQVPDFPLVTASTVSRWRSLTTDRGKIHGRGRREGRKNTTKTVTQHGSRREAESFKIKRLRCKIVTPLFGTRDQRDCSSLQSLFSCRFSGVTGHLFVRGVPCRPFPWPHLQPSGLEGPWEHGPDRTEPKLSSLKWLPKTQGVS